MLDGGLGYGDIAAYRDAGSAVEISLLVGSDAQNTGGAGIDRLSGFESLQGSAHNDKLTGNWGGNRLFGEFGDDELRGLGAEDWLYGWEGNDKLFGDDGNDYLYGQAGDDELFGWTGNDELLGETGADKLFGQAGSDTLLGWEGDDLLVGGAGNDVMDGQGGTDTYQWNNADYNAGGLDRILAYEASDIYRIEGNSGQTISYHSFGGGAAIDVNLAGGGVFVIDVVGATQAQLMNQIVII